MAFGRSNLKFALKEFQLFIGTWTTPELIGTNNTDPLSYFTGDDLGFLPQGTINLDLPIEYAEAPSGTPSILARKDPIRLGFGIEAAMYQVNPDIWETIQGFETQANYSITTPTTKTIDIAHVGHDQPTPVTAGIFGSAKLTDGTNWYIGMFNARFTIEQRGAALSGTDYGQFPFKAEAFPSTSATSDTRDYGIIWKEN